MKYIRRMKALYVEAKTVEHAEKRKASVHFEDKMVLKEEDNSKLMLPNNMQKMLEGYASMQN